MEFLHPGLGPVRHLRSRGNHRGSGQTVDRPVGWQGVFESRSGNVDGAGRSDAGVAGGNTSADRADSGYEVGKTALLRHRLLQRLHDDTKADFVGKYKLVPICAKGFYDPIYGGSCWECPPGYDGRGDYIRSSTAVTSDTACWRAPVEATGRATKVKSPAWAWDCPAGSFWDGYSPDGIGGSCWQCPDRPSAQDGCRRLGVQCLRDRYQSDDAGALPVV